MISRLICGCTPVTFRAGMLGSCLACQAAMGFCLGHDDLLLPCRTWLARGVLLSVPGCYGLLLRVRRSHSAASYCLGSLRPAPSPPTCRGRPGFVGPSACAGSRPPRGPSTPDGCAGF